MTDPNAAAAQPDISMQGAVDLSSLGQQPGSAPQQQGAPAGAPGGAPLMSLPDAVVNGGEAELEQFAGLSQRMPVLVEMHSASSPDSQALSPVLAEIVRSAEGRLVLLRLDLDANPTLGGQAQVLALIGGRPAPLFTGNPPQEQVVQVISEVLAVAAQQGLTGHVQITGETEDETDAPAEAPLPPLHQEAQDALQRGDIAAAKSAYERAISEAPADDAAKVGLAQVSLLERLQGKSLEEIRSGAADNPNDIDAQFLVADLDLSGGHVDDAFNRLLNLFAKVDADSKTRIRERLVELFDVVGADEPRVVRARQRLTSLLFA